MFTIKIDKKYKHIVVTSLLDKNEIFPFNNFSTDPYKVLLASKGANIPNLLLSIATNIIVPIQ